MKEKPLSDYDIGYAQGYNSGHTDGKKKSSYNQGYELGYSQGHQAGKGQAKRIFETNFFTGLGIWFCALLLLIVIGTLIINTAH